MERETGVASSRRFSRRQVLKHVPDVVLGGMVLYATYRFSQEIGKVKEKESLVGKAIEGEPLAEYRTDPAGDIFEVPLRKSPKLGDSRIIGWTKPGFTFVARKEYGVVYVGGKNFVTEVDGKSYGIWYKGAGLPVFEKSKEGELIPKLDEKGRQVKSGTVHVSGNFLVNTEKTEGNSDAGQ